VQNAFETFIRDHGLCRPEDRVLLAVSGGVDSVVMTHLFRAARYDCALAHCNFQLRGMDSDADEAFVRSLSDTVGYPVYVKHFDVEGDVRISGGSVQMVARDLRYSWFQELAGEQRFDAIATAHNLNDSVETFFLNITRGTGIRGLLGIPVRNNNIIRPLLFSTRTEILDFCKQNGLEYREDASNLETKYTRNKVRHDLLPVVEQINPSFLKIIAREMKNLQEVETIFREAVNRKRESLFRATHDRITIDIASLRTLEPQGTWLYELFSPYGFSRSQCEGIPQIMEASPGRRSISPSHQLYKDRDSLILIKTGVKEVHRYYLDSPERHSSLPFSLDMEVLEKSELKEIPTDPAIACLDMDLIQFPLTIRHWLHGDYFYPLGMEQMKKLSDFFVDNKVPLPEKDRTWILASGRKIVWIVGLRIDHRFRITENTKWVLMLTFQSDVAPQPGKEIT
jgi:tRNA(Ile)-lysidine synthase